MFTGIVEQTGVAKKLSPKGGIYRLEVLPSVKIEPLKVGDSICVNGACLTVVKSERGLVFFDMMRQTFEKTSFRYLKNSETVNLERALGEASRLDGHFVLGHVDGVRRISAIEKTKHPFLDIKLAAGDKKYVVEKGSVAVDGVSLTIGGVFDDKFRCYLIPHTLMFTSLKGKKRGDPVNIEFDILGKYINNRAEYKNKSLKKLLAAEGFI